MSTCVVCVTLILIVIIYGIVFITKIHSKLITTKKDLQQAKNELLHLYEAFARVKQYGDNTDNIRNPVIDSRYSTERIMKRIKELEQQI